MSKENCTTCKHVRRTASDLFCTRFPPQVTLVPILDETKKPIPNEYVPRGSFPPVLPNWKCGEHVAAIVIAR